MKDPAFLFYSDNFLSGTMFLTDEQTGKYIRLLCAQHLTGHLKENHMIFICKSYDKDIWDKFKKDDEGLFYNERLDIEIIRRKKYSESRSNNKKGKVKEQSKKQKSYDLHMGNENENILYSLFYDSEIEKSKNDQSYITVVKTLFGENKLNRKLNGVLKIENQLSFDEFSKLLKQSAEKGRSIIDMLENMENGKYYKNKASIYKTLLNWLNR